MARLIRPAEGVIIPDRRTSAQGARLCQGAKAQGLCTRGRARRGHLNEVWMACWGASTKWQRRRRGCLLVRCWEGRAEVLCSSYLRCGGYDAQRHEVE